MSDLECSLIRGLRAPDRTGIDRLAEPLRSGEMGDSVARYDANAEWYPLWVGEDPGLVCEHIASDDLGGQRWLDVACGAGRTSRELARRGASVVGVDLSAELLERARASHVDADTGAGTYLVADVARTAEWWEGLPLPC